MTVFVLGRRLLSMIKDLVARFGVTRLAHDSKRRRWLLVLASAMVVLVVSGTALGVALQRPPPVARPIPPKPTPRPTYAPPAGATLTPPQHHIGPDFAAYYTQQQGSRWLGTAISPEFVYQSGQEQIFQGGILRMTTSGTVTSVADVADLITHGVVVPVADPAANVTYATLWPSMAPAAAPWWWQSGSDPQQNGLFVAAASSADQTLGYYIPATFVPFLIQLGRWQALLGTPITQTYAVSAREPDGTHKLVIMAFAHAVLWLDRATAGAPQVAWQHAGADDLLTFGAPHIVASGRAAWSAIAPAQVLSAPGNGTAVATFATPFTLTCLGDASWQGDTLWYHVAWQNLAQQRDGWLDEDHLRFTAPGQVGRQIGDLGALSSPLRADVLQQGADIGVAIYLPTTNRLFLANASQQMEMDSTFKIPILVTLLHETEQQGRPLTGEEDQEATVMIEQSDNTAFEGLYEDAGGATAIEGYMRAIGIPSVNVNTSGIGSTLIAPQDMVTLLDDLQDGHILTAADAQYVLNLMRHIVPGQRMGIGDTAPAGASYAMKDGYSPGIDFGFNMNSVGIVTDKGNTYIIVVYSRHHASQATGVQIVDAICADVVKALLAP